MRQQIHLDGSLRPMPSPGLARTDRREGAPEQKFSYPEFLSLSLSAQRKTISITREYLRFTQSSTKILSSPSKLE